MDRRYALGLFATAFISVAAFPNNSFSEAKSLKDQLIGTWIYESSTAVREDGSAVARPRLQGAVTYTAEGRFHFITVRSDAPKYASGDSARPSPEEAMAIASGVVAYTGTYTVDESTKTIHVNIEASSFPNLVGAPNQRRIVTSLTNDQLEFTNPRTPAGITLQLVFKRAK
ncbi:lipocalin-like domain-containing protein [Bradyrhizobium elkanii]|uniref:lipocalin-like domain-containing protein n=1 Tax=Bradyrhizobium elkanii TaxID=29448 RepID=UPI001BAD0D18|nr:lipocalin-like domain-containing protein [Bradyrhizobium elkanii]MBR1163486.1 lipocalin-like domain-containing protein [Bradyrhizobium elkanii]